MPPIVTLRPMLEEDLATVGSWLEASHVARWFLPETTADAELAKYRRRIEDPLRTTVMCTVELDGEPIGWCQWYCWDDYPEAARCNGASAGEVGADYAIGVVTATGRGVGTAMIGALVFEVRRHHPRAGLVIAPEADNWASRRVLEKNGFALVDVRPLTSEPHRRPMAIYRLPSARPPRGGDR